MQEHEQVDSTGMLILGHEHQVQQNQESWPTELLSLLIIIHYTDSAGVLHKYVEVFRSMNRCLYGFI